MTEISDSLKESIHAQCLSMIEERLRLLNQNFSQSREDLQGESRSTAGDKHETGRAMIQLEQEKMSHQLIQTEKTLQLLKRVPFKKKCQQAQSGALVKSSLGLLFISVGIGEITVEDQKVFVIAPSSPLAQCLLGAEAGSEVNFREKKVKVLDIA